MTKKRPWNDTNVVGGKTKKKRKESEHVGCVCFSTFVRLKKRVLTELESMFFFGKREDQAKHNAKSLYSKVYLLVV